MLSCLGTALHMTNVKRHLCRMCPVFIFPTISIIHSYPLPPSFPSQGSGVLITHLQHKQTDKYCIHPWLGINLCLSLAQLLILSQFL